MHRYASASPRGALFVVGLDLKPIVVLLLINFDISDDSLDLFCKPLFPFLVLGTCVDGEQWNVVSCLFY